MKPSIIFCMLFIILAASTARAEFRETLLGLQTDFRAKTLTIEVMGSGCTDESYFRLEFANDLLTIYRLKRDACKAAPMKTSITYRLDELGIDPNKPFRVGNPFIVNEYLAGMDFKSGKQQAPQAGR